MQYMFYQGPQDIIYCKRAPVTSNFLKNTQFRIVIVT